MRRFLNYCNYQQQKTREMIGILFMVFIGIIILCVKWNVKVDTVDDTKSCAYTSMQREKVVTKVCVEKGASLWQYADLYYTDDFPTREDMIKEIKAVNGLTQDTIHEGGYLLIPHYVDM